MTQTPSLNVEWNLDHSTWSAALAECPEATYFHTSDWLRAVSVAFHTRLSLARFQLEGGRFALLPLSVRSLAKGLVPYASAGEIGGYGGLVSPRPLEAAEVAAIYQIVRTRFPDLAVTGNPFTTSPHLGVGVPGTSRRDESTHLLELQALDLLRQNFSRGCKSRGNKARKQGFEVEVTRTPEAIADFYDLYLDSVRRWGEKLTWIRPRTFFEAVLAQEAGHARLFVARRDGRAESALLFAAYGSATHYLAGATHADALAGCPSNLLMEEAMAYYHQAGFRWFDFGPSNGLEGVVQFKTSFGANPAPFQSTRNTSAAGRLYVSLRGAREKLVTAMRPQKSEADAPASLAG